MPTAAACSGPFRDVYASIRWLFDNPEQLNISPPDRGSSTAVLLSSRGRPVLAHADGLQLIRRHALSLGR